MANATECQSLRGYLAMVGRERPEERVRIGAPVSRERDITLTVFEFERAARSPVLIF